MRAIAVISLIFFFPISAAGFIASDERLQALEFQRYPEVFQNGKLVLRRGSEGMLAASSAGIRTSSLYPQTAFLFPPEPSDLGIKLSPQIHYQFIETPYSTGWTILGTILNVLAPTYGEIKMHRNGNSFWQPRMRVINESDPTSRDLYQ